VLSTEATEKTFLQSGLSYESVLKATKILKVHAHQVHVMHEFKEPDIRKNYFSTAESSHAPFKVVKTF
jgi:hypothetical protein